MIKNELTYERLHELLHYDPDTGIFRRLITTSQNAKKGDMAGGVCKSPNRGYRIISLDNKSHKASRLAFLYMEGYFPEYQVDHINRVRDDDRWCNLRHVTPSCNTRNSGVSEKNTSGIKGVSWHSKTNKWRVHILGMHVGVFKSKLEAVQARWQAEKKYNYPNCQTSSSAYSYLKEHDNKRRKNDTKND